MAGRFPQLSHFEDDYRRDSGPRTRGVRELHWHPTADEWQYIIEGKVSITMFGSAAGTGPKRWKRAMLAFIPQGYGHSIENVGDKTCRVLIGFNNGVYETIDLSQWVAGNPTDVLATNFGKPGALFKKFPQNDVFIASKDGI